MKKSRAAALAAIGAASAALMLVASMSYPPTADLPAPIPSPSPDGAALSPGPSSAPSPLSHAGGAPARDIDLDPPLAPPAAHASSVNEFAFGLYRAVSTDGDDNEEEEEDPNLFFSPVSIHTAFSVLYEGARDKTAQELQDVFRFDPDPAARHAAATAAAASIGRGDGHSELSLANALWVADWFAPYDSYLGTARGAYGATVDTVDFVDEDDAVPRINAWASDNTHGKIKKVISQRDVDAKTAMVINNAIYFKGTWVTQFPEEGTHEGAFTREDGSATQVAFMEVTAEFGHATLDGYQVLRMPYKGERLSMIIVLPDEPGGLGPLADGLSASALDGWIAGLEPRAVRAVVPKFEAETNYDLKDLLMTMGVVEAFDKYRADLTGLGHTERGRLYVDAATHDAFVSVNEKGTEAAAVTTIIVMAESEQPRPLDFVADRPFLFVIHDTETGAILFMGRMSDPPDPR